MNAPHHHHYAPRFYLRNFAVDPERNKVNAIAKHGQRAVWSKRSIEYLGFERDLYVHTRVGVPVSVETVINKDIETPISESETWAKIATGRTDALDRSDKPILFALIRHLEARTPHYEATDLELAKHAASGDSGIPFTDEERVMYAYLRSSPERAKAFFNAMSASVVWTELDFRGAGISIYRSPIPLRTSTTPVLAMRAPDHPALRLPLPGMVPYTLILTLNRTTIASLVLADFDDAFMNVEIGVETAMAFNRQYAARFAYYDRVQHLVADRRDLIDDMTWARYELVKDTDEKITFFRRP
jgi:Protein of unknown function (DUF4238)